jgi:heme-degrading monooxygenase HmoA
MYARSTSIRSTPAKLDNGIRYVADEVLPGLGQSDGCLGLSMLTNRDDGRCIVTTSWRDEESMRATAEEARTLRHHLEHTLGGEHSDVQEWEIAILHRTREAPEGACARVTWARGEPAQIDDRMSTMRTAMLPRVEELPGFCSVSVLMNRNTGEGVTATVYESREAMDRAADQGMTMRGDIARQMNMEITEVAEMELVLAHLRVPETV